MADNLTVETKIVVLGESGVGKTSLVLRYVHNQFYAVLNPTIGASFLTKTIHASNVKMKIQLWDTAGQERFRSLAPMYYRGASVALLVYDITSEDSFRKVKEWVRELKSNLITDILMVLVGNQMDKPGRRIEISEANAYAESIGAICFETSAKQGTGIEPMFAEIAKRLMQVVQSHFVEENEKSQHSIVTPSKQQEPSFKTYQSQESCC